MKQEIFKTLKEARELFNDWKNKEDYVRIIFSGGKYFVENEPNMVRNWEKVIDVWEGDGR